MALIAADLLRLLQSLLPPGVALPLDRDESNLAKMLSGVGAQLLTAQQRFEALLAQADPRVADEMLPDWERLLGLPDECIAVRTQSLAYGLYPGVSLAEIATFSRAGDATYVDAAGVLRTAAANVPRVDFDAVTLALKGLLIEGTRWNELLYSQQFDNAAWTKGTLTVTANAVAAPDGTVTADLLTATGGDSYVLQVPAFPASTAYTFSVWLRAAAPVTISLCTRQNPSAIDVYNLACNVTTAWQRFSVSGVSAVGNTTLQVSIGGFNGLSTGEAVYAWGAQLEGAAAASSYIPTTVAAALRAADICSIYLPLTVDERRIFAGQRLVEQGGQSRAYFIGLTEQLGEPGCTIDEFRPMHCNDDCNDALYSDADRFAWRVNVPRAASNVHVAHCNDNCNSALQSYTPSLIECPITERRPAHTTVLFAYAP